jgi:F-type H+-transporting ATPase subunit gamma
MAASRPYADKMRAVVGHLAQGHPEYKHPYLVERDVKGAGFILISSDRGLCGGLNTNLFRAAVTGLKSRSEQKIELKLCTIGSKASAFFKRMGGNIVGQATHLGDAPQMNDLIGTVKIMLDAYDDGAIDELYVVYNQFVNTMTQQPIVMRLLPAEPGGDEELKHHWDYIYEPEAKETLDALLTRYIESLVYQGVVENIACEQAARMVAMKAASDNAGTIIDELQLVYNKARQAAITQEISEIVGGAAAV